MKNSAAGTCVFFFLACALGLSSCGKRDKESAFERVTVGKVDLRDVITQTGEVRPIVKVEVKSEASGRIDRIFIKEGQQVRKGDTILVIDPSRLRLRKQRADLAVERARLDLEKAEMSLGDAKAVASSGTVSRRRIEDLEREVRAARIGVDQQVLDRKDLVDQLGQTVVTAPMAGVVTILGVEEGEIAVSATTGNQAGTSLCTIADISKLEVVTQVGEVDYVHVRQGQRVTIRPEAIEGAKTRGTVTFLSLSAKKKSQDGLGTFEVRVSVDSVIAGISAGINVSVDFVIMEKRGVAGLPYYALKKRGDRYGVLVLPKDSRGKPEFRPVRAGATDFRHTEILGGLSPGDTVVVPSQENESGQRRRPDVGGMGGGGGGGGRGRR